MAINSLPIVPGAASELEKTLLLSVVKIAKKSFLTYAKGSIYRNLAVIWSCRQMRRV